MEITKEQLEYWRHQEGKSNVEIAEMTGKSIDVINNMFSRYKIRQRRRGIPEEKVNLIHKMLEDGSRPYQIAAELGISRGAVYKYMPEKEMEEEFDLPLDLTMAEQRKPQIFEVFIDGKRYMDVTDLFIPY